MIMTIQVYSQTRSYFINASRSNQPNTISWPLVVQCDTFFVVRWPFYLLIFSANLETYDIKYTPQGVE